MEVSQKLKQLLPHWAEHNDAHAESYADWARQAREAGLEATAQKILDAVSLIEDANGELKKALAELEESE